MTRSRARIVPVVVALACGDSSSTGAADSSEGSTSRADTTTVGSTDVTTDTPMPQTSATSDSSSGHATSSTSTSGSDVPDVREGFTVGVDSASITPAELQPTIYLGSYGLPFMRAAEGVHDDIFVRSFALGTADSGIVFAVTDLPGLGNHFTRDVRARVAEATGLPEHQVLLGATHTHSSPDFQGLWGGGPDAYRDVAIDSVVASMTAAWLARVPATLEVSTTAAPNHNRRDWGFTDDALTVLRAVDADGEALGMITVFAAHPTVLGESNHDISRDWCGYAVDRMEARTAATVLLFNGVLGDASPDVPEGEYVDDFERASAYGTVVADAALDAITTAEPVDAELFVDHRTWSLVGTNVLFNLAAQVGLLDYDYDEKGGALSVDTQATYVRLGTQLQIVTFPGEPVTRLGLPIKDAMTAPHRVLLGQTNDMLGYFIPSDEWMMGHNADYEESISLGPDVGDITRDVLIALIENDAFVTRNRAER
jgi:hypothetical protein